MGEDPGHGPAVGPGTTGGSQAPTGGRRPGRRRHGRCVDDARARTRPRSRTGCAAPARRGDLAPADRTGAARDTVGPRPDRRRRRVRDTHRVLVLRGAARLHLPTRQCPDVRAAGTRAGLPRRAQPRPFPVLPGTEPRADLRHGRRRWCVRRMGAGSLEPTRRARRLLVPVSARIPAVGPVEDALRRCVRGGHLPRTARHPARHLAMARSRPDRPGDHRKSAERSRRWIRLVRPRGRAPRPAADRHLAPEG